jgi:hypothetical protein
MAAQSLSPDNTKKIRQSFETGYEEETGFLPPKEELRFFLLIDLFNRIETETNFTHSLLEQELLSWSKTLKKCAL